MKRLGCFIVVPLSLMLLFAFAKPLSAEDVVVIEGAAVKPFEEALKGFEHNCGCNVKGVLALDMKDADPMAFIEKLKPDKVVAIGEEALKSVKNITNKQVIYMMVLNPTLYTAGKSNFTGISMIIPPAKQLRAIRSVFPNVDRLGVLYNPENSENIVRTARSVAASMGFEIITHEVHSPKDIPGALNAIKHKIEALWLIPDVTVAPPEMIELYELFSVHYNKPLFTFADKHLERGASLSVSISPVDIGKQAGEILKNSYANKSNLHDVTVAKVSLNPVVATKMVLVINEPFRKENTVFMDISQLKR
ncbi:ABC transporter substrate-binding protein [Candidatus Magnetomonas plexicatena]|uniref:ABC transporter substrate-binding protein n=1 Tax=Candidatus Magnetomonas plexicatena TaxID=2552947 RepID=UPI001C7403AE|nr:hypothetical protein E2O03_015390 [Nitrospirales bacterium LBB_01]